MSSVKENKDGWTKVEFEYELRGDFGLKYETDWIDELPERVRITIANAIIDRIKDYRIHIQSK